MYHGQGGTGAQLLEAATVSNLKKVEVRYIALPTLMLRNVYYTYSATNKINKIKPLLNHGAFDLINVKSPMYVPDGDRLH